MPLVDSSADLAQNRLRRPASRSPANLRDDAEVAGEAAAVLDLNERADPIEADVGPDAADRPDVPRDEVRRPLAGEPHDADVVRKPGERVAGQVRAAARHVDEPRPAGGPTRRLPRLPHRLVGHAAGVDDRDVRVGARLEVAVRSQPLADLLGVGLRDLAAEELDGEGRHQGADASPRGRAGPAGSGA